MLVLSRHRDESIVINDNIVVTVVEIRGDKVRLGIEAPKDVTVNRQEVWQAIQREKRNETGALAGRGSGLPTRTDTGTGQGSIPAAGPVHRVGKEEGAESSKS